ncbi:beta-ketoacyl-ACP synthase III [Anaplasma bovis]|uniref:beta-ketoacyl-ACP synthase III n=1 Tax=Anaplasma bovis TaxID=186733 RepID=UPI002FF41E6F
MKAILRGTGHFLPENVVTNDDLSKMVDTTDEWIVKRTGIKSRHIAGPQDTTLHMASEAAACAIRDAGISACDVDLIVVATSTPDRTLPSVATMLQSKLGCTNAYAFDINAACSGFVYALSVVDSLIKSGQARVALVVGAEAMSKIVDWEDRSTCVLFGDGAGACILGVDENAGDRGFISTILRSDGSLSDILYTDGGVCTTNTAGHIRMKGPVLFEHAVIRLCSVIRDILDKTGISIDDIDWFIPHQANVRIVDLVTKKLNFPNDRVALYIEKHANTSAASIPLAMHFMRKEGKLLEGQLVLFAAMGAGFTWGASLLRV